MVALEPGTLFFLLCRWRGVGLRPPVYPDARGGTKIARRIQVSQVDKEYIPFSRPCQALSASLRWAVPALLRGASTDEAPPGLACASARQKDGPCIPQGRTVVKHKRNKFPSRSPAGGDIEDAMGHHWLAIAVVSRPIPSICAPKGARREGIGRLGMFEIVVKNLANPMSRRLGEVIPYKTYHVCARARVHVNYLKHLPTPPQLRLSRRSGDHRCSPDAAGGCRQSR